MALHILTFKFGFLGCHAHQDKMCRFLT